jgi:hypothetical protein
LDNEELHNLYCSPSIIRIIQVREDGMGRACNTNGGGAECIYDIGGKARRKETTRGDLDVGGRIILKWMLEK